jgi:DoxX-like family
MVLHPKEKSMAWSAPISPVSKAPVWIGWVMSAIVALLILLSGVMKLMRLPQVIAGFAKTGVPEHLILPVGLIESLCVVAYLIPQTSILGAILMTGLLGGATITTLRIGDPTYPVPVVLGMLAWGGLWLRESRLQALIPLKRS